MKVFIITAAFPPMAIAGESDHAYHLCKHLADSGLDVHVLTTQGNLIVSHPRVTVYPVMRKWSWLELPRLARLVRRCSADALLLLYSSGPHYHYHPMIAFIPTVSKLIRPEARFVTLFENVTSPRWSSLPRRMIRKMLSPWTGAFGTLLSTSDRIIVMSEQQQVILSTHDAVVNHKSVLIPPPPIMPICPENNGVYRQRGRRLLGIAPNDFLLAYFGYLYPNKGIETLLQAFHLVSMRRSCVRLIMIGGSVSLPDRPSYAQEMQELSQQLGIDDRIIWTGAYAWDTEDASMYLRSADICVLPFKRGVQLNNSSFAACAAHGLPIITTQGARIEAPFIHKKSVFLCPPQTPKTMAAAIEVLIDKPNLRHRLSQGALHMAQEWFSWETAIKHTVNTFVYSESTP